MNMDGITTNPDMERINADEQLLASELRGLCSPLGQERKENLLKSADVLERMGSLYLEKVEATGGMLQKLTIIRCCALLHGARVRFKMLNAQERVAKVDRVLGSFEQLVTRIVPPMKVFGNLLETSDDVSRRLETMRNEYGQKIEKLSKIENDVDEEALNQMEKVKIKEIRELNLEITESYKILMTDIAMKCIDFLGAPRCRFAMIGLGSMARNEITLSSDFEHVIGLQDGIENSEEYPQIQEYFRWFAVIFQVIIIGLGETFIRSVGVKSLNDLYSEDRSKNWYFDNFTPCGIEFDGMVPHSCNNPLGRQESTKKRTHIVELIQPAHRLANYLTCDEHIKNGYYLKDVLSRTCLVYGSEEVYSDFLATSKGILARQSATDSLKDQLDQISENVNVFVRTIIMQRQEDHYCPKTNWYRPITASLATLGKIFKLDSTCTFDIVAELATKGIINEKALHDLQYAVALACELRMKVYAKTKHQRDRISSQEVVGHIGKRGAVDGKTIIDCLKFTIFLKKEELLEGNFHAFDTDFRKANDLGLMQSYFAYGFDKEAAELGLLLTQYDETIWFWVAQCYVSMGAEEEQIDLQDEYWRIAEEGYNHLFQLDDVESYMIHSGYAELCGICTTQGRFEDGLRYLDAWIQRCNVDEKMAGSFENVILEIWNFDFQLRSAVGGANEYFWNVIKFVPADERPGISGPIMASEATRRIGDAEHARKYFHSLVCNYKDKAFGTLNYNKDANNLDGILYIQMGRGWQEDALLTLRVIKDALPHGGQEVDESMDDYSTMEAELLSGLNRHQSCIDVIESMTNEQSREELNGILAISHAALEQSVAEKMKLLKRAIEHSRRHSEEIDEKLYCRAIVDLLSCSISPSGDVDAAVLHDVTQHYLSVPGFLKRDIILQHHIHHFLYRLACSIVRDSEASDRKGMCCERMNMILDIFGNYVLLPIQFAAFCFIPHVFENHPVGERLHKAKRNFSKKQCYGEVDSLHQAVEFFVLNDTEKCANTLWAILNDRRLRFTGAFKKSMELLLVLVLRFGFVGEGYKMSSNLKYLFFIFDE